MTEPTTEAGRASDEERVAFKRAELARWNDGECAERVAKATADLRAELAERVRALHQQMRDHFGAAPDEYVLLDPAAVVAIIEEKP